MKLIRTDDTIPKENDGGGIKYVCLSKVIEKYGIPKKTVEKFFPNPKLVDNPHGRRAPKMKLYDITEVEKLLSENE